MAPRLPFDCIVGTDFEDIQNPFSGETVNCPPDFVAVYDTIKGAELMGEYEHMDKGLNWARQYYPELIDNFNDASVFSVFLDLNAAIGDNLHYHMDRSIQETVL